METEAQSGERNYSSPTMAQIWIQARQSPSPATHVFLHAESQCPGPFRRAVSETTPPTRPLPPTPRESQPSHVGPLPIFILSVSLSSFSPNPHPLTSSGADPPFRFPLEQKVTFHQGYVLLLRMVGGWGREWEMSKRSANRSDQVLPLH